MEASTTTPPITHTNPEIWGGLTMLPQLGEGLLDGVTDEWDLQILGGISMGLDSQGVLVCKEPFPTRLEHYTSVVGLVQTTAESGPLHGEIWNSDIEKRLHEVFPKIEIVPPFFTYPEVARKLKEQGIPLQAVWYGAPGALRAWAPLLDAACLLQKSFSTDYTLLINTVTGAAQYDAYTNLHGEVVTAAAAVTRNLLETQLWSSVPELQDLQNILAPQSWPY